MEGSREQRGHIIKCQCKQTQPHNVTPHETVDSVSYEYTYKRAHLQFAHSFNSFFDTLIFLRSYEYVDAFDLWKVTEYLLQETLSHETGGSGKEYALPGVELRQTGPWRRRGGRRRLARVVQRLLDVSHDEKERKKERHFSSSHSQEENK